jgi:hypothetical protein
MSGSRATLSESKQSRLLSLYGAGKELFAELGGGEAWLKQERENFYGEKGEPQWTRMPSSEEIRALIESMRSYRESVKKISAIDRKSDDSVLSILDE